MDYKYNIIHQGIILLHVSLTTIIYLFLKVGVLKTPVGLIKYFCVVGNCYNIIHFFSLLLHTL